MRDQPTSSHADSSQDPANVLTGIETAAAGTVVKLAIERAAPAGIARVRAWLTGKTIVVVGPPRAGKTTFVEYLQYGIFQHADETERTYDPMSSPRFNLRVGRDNSLEVSIKTAVDLPGQPAARKLADLVVPERPHGLVIVLDLSRPLEGDDEATASAAWLRNFCARFDQLSHGMKPKRNRLRVVVIMMNKMDLVAPDVVVASEATYRAVMRDQWRASRGPHTGEPLFRKSVLVENPDGTKWVDKVLVDLATALARKA